MEKFKLTELQKYNLLQAAFTEIISQGRSYHYFISPSDCDRIKFNVGAYSKKNGCRIEVVYYFFGGCTVRLLWHYVKKPIFESIEGFAFTPKLITIEREFKSSILISIVPEPDGSRWIYQSLKSIYELCEEDSVEDVGAVEPAGVCHVVADVDSSQF